ncbi:MAG TPA: HAD-IB family phosphatase [Anaerolineae bacterium]|nr:HAD-IB family phosphatase [Anaerolineae bacterium]
MTNTKIITTDLEGTLTAGNTWKGLRHYLQNHGRATDFRLFFLRQLPPLLLMRLGLRDRRQTRAQFMIDLLTLFTNTSLTDFDTIATWAIDNSLAPGLYPDVLHELQQQRDQGARIIIISGAFQPVLDKLATQLGFEAFGTPVEIENGRLTGRIAAPINTGPHKVERIQAILGPHTPIHTAYGDTMPDLPMLTYAQNAVVVNPPPPLEQHAQQHNWRIIKTT